MDTLQRAGQRHPGPRRPAGDPARAGGSGRRAAGRPRCRAGAPPGAGHAGDPVDRDAAGGARIAAAAVTDLRPIETRLGALEGKPPVDLKPLEARLGAAGRPSRRSIWARSTPGWRLWKPSRRSIWARCNRRSRPRRANPPTTPARSASGSTRTTARQKQAARRRRAQQIDGSSLAETASKLGCGRAEGRSSPGGCRPPAPRWKPGSGSARSRARRRRWRGSRMTRRRPRPGCGCRSTRPPTTRHRVSQPAIMDNQPLAEPAVDPGAAGR